MTIVTISDKRGIDERRKIPLIIKFYSFEFIKCIVRTCLTQTCNVKFFKKKHVMHRNTIYKTQLSNAKPVYLLGTE